MYAPVLITVYDRLSKLKECVNSLISNKEALETDLYIAIDFPYKKEDEFTHKEIINFCKKIIGFKSVNPIIREVNYGPERNAHEARLQLLKNYPYAIFLEDDNIVSPNFLEYMNKALKFYEGDDRIFSITGYNYPVQMPFEYKNSCYLWTGFNGYGNGWWKSKFNYSYLDYNNFLDFLADKSKVTQFFNIANHILPIILSGLKKGLIYGDAALSYNLFLNNRYQLYPTISKVRNTGYDGSGINCNINDIYINQQIDDGTGKIEFIKDIQPDKRIYEILYDHFKISVFEIINLEKDIEEYTERIKHAGTRLQQNFSIPRQTEIKPNIPACPLTNRNNVVFEKQIYCNNIIQAYQQNFNIDVTRYFGGLENIKIYRCLDTDFRFYYPLDLEGDSEFYEALQHIPWYYMDWKWEYDIAKTLIKRGDHVMEIGCGKGSFVENLTKERIACTGLELNEDSSRRAKEKGLNIFNETISEHIKSNFERYDVVCSFQVLEHIALVQEFMKDSITALKPGGKLIVSVPNHDSFIGLDEVNILDMPPHHMGLWNEKSLKSISEIFDIKVNKVYIEPLQSYHIDYYIGIMKRVINNKLGLHNIVEGIARNFPENIKGHTALAEYIK